MQVRQTSRVALAALALAVFGLVLGGLVAPATAASSTGKVKGVVSTSGKPIERAKVQIYRTITDVRSGEELAKATRLKTDNTDSKGRFSFSKVTVKAGYSYTLLVTDRTGNTVKTFRTFAPKKNKTITTNVRMEAAAVLKGTVNTVDGRSPAGLTVSVEPGAYPDQDHADDLFHPAWSTTVKADGTYVLKIPANNYDGVLVSDGRYAVQCIDFAAGSLADCGTDRAAFEPSRRSHHRSPRSPARSPTRRARRSRASASASRPAVPRRPGRPDPADGSTSGRAFPQVRIPSGSTTRTPSGHRST
jgi:hypothetical protein